MDKLKQLWTPTDSNPLFVALSGIFGHKCHTIVLEECMTKLTHDLTEVRNNLIKQEDAMDVLQGMVEDHFEEQMDFVREIEELQMLLTSRDEECVFLNKELKTALKELEEHKRQTDRSLSAMENQIRLQKDAISKLWQTTNEMKKDNANLKKELENALREKEVLKKRLANIQAYRFKATDKWMDDKKVNNCVYCNVQFKFFLRKHHCRLCGKVCCHSCSNYWLPTTARSLRGISRVCKYCFEDRMSVLDAVVAETTEARDEPEMRNFVTKNESSLPRDIIRAEKSSIASDVIGSPSSVVTNCEGSDASVDLLPSSPNEHPELSDRVPLTLPIHRNAKEREVAVSPIDWISVGSTTSFSSDANAPKCSGSGYLGPISPCSDYKEIVSADKTIMDFHIITDEEINRTLSAYGPYSPLENQKSESETRVQMCDTRTVSDIEENKNNISNGVLWILPGGECGIPIMVETHKHVKLLWEFTSDPQCIVFSVSYMDLGSQLPSEMKPLMYPTQVRSHMYCISGHIVAKNPGLYILLFNNSFSRFIVNKITFHLSIQWGTDDQTMPISVAPR